MMADPNDSLSQLLDRWKSGDTQAGDELVRLVYDELHRLARRRMDGQKPWHTLQATALVNEAVVRMFKDGPSDCRDVDHFLAVAARAMRSVLVDHARRKGRQKRSGVREDIPLELLTERYEERATDLVALDESLKKLAEVDPDLARLVELHFFGRISLREISRIENRPRHVVEREWQLARAWLRKHMS